MKERFIELLEQDAAQAHIATEHWKALDGARLEDGQGKTIATAADMVAKFTARENEFRTMIANLKTLP